jgi:hypothetical protein
MAMMAMTTSSSMSVNAKSFLGGIRQRYSKEALYSSDKLGFVARFLKTRHVVWGDW